MKSLRTLGLVGLIGIASCAPSQEESVTTQGLPTPYRLEQAPLADDSTSVVSQDALPARTGLDPRYTSASFRGQYEGVCIICPDGKGSYAPRP